ncbi:chloride channel protein [Streptomyces sp. TLI_171]|uniref:chloride channel protein n=1 Tax=Streptomyces sp. TLI_171 TaxID=1938859 RepID=UPI000C18A293|nr:chloride channel protein [Streptomyces sp. TLI_171]RKE17378.1 H+/Cl- antiporter ClcA [Streptomyces sp. TLI_171]
MTGTDVHTAPEPAPPDPAALLASPKYLVLLVFGALIGVPVAAASYFFQKGVTEVQQYTFTTLPKDLGFASAPVWWPVLPLTVSGLLVAASIRYLPGSSGHRPAEGFKQGGPVRPVDLFGIVLAAFATLGLGAVLGPEAPLIALGSGLGVLAVRLVRRDTPAQAVAVVAAAGSFAAVAALLGSPLSGAFLLMETAGIGGALLGVILVPGLLAAGIGSLIFVGLDAWTGYGTFSLTIGHIPAFTTPDGTQFLWAVAIGVCAALLGTAIRCAALLLQGLVEPRRLWATPLVGLAVAGCVIAFGEATGHGQDQVLFSGQAALPRLVGDAGSWTAGALVLLLLFKGLAYGLSLSCFRGGPVFPSLFLGAAGGMALSHLPGLPMIAGVGMGIGAMCVAMLDLPLTSVLIPSILLASDALALMPLVIVAVVVSYVLTARLAPLRRKAAPATE